MVGITMVHGFNDKGISPYRLTHKASRAIKVRHKIFRIFSGVMASIFLVSAVPASVGAMETTKASALVLEELGAKDLSFTKKSPHEAQADPCLPLLHARRLSPGASAMGFNNRRPVGKTATPVALGLVLGIRIALGPKDVVKPSERVQIGPEIRTDRVGDDNYALAVAAYRGCKNRHTLNLLKKHND
ncbi:MAG TPA: hypothetical protein PLF01_02275 [Alphaproteobacteria bacterium]|nr:hypothetical protein [Alphaproteobacteria bacterium]